MHLLTSTSRAGTLLLFYGSNGLLEGFFHRFPSRLLNLLFHLAPGSGCLQFYLERYYHVHERFLPVFFRFF
jgi:hypothetical protein